MGTKLPVQYSLFDRVTSEFRRGAQAQFIH
jgi:hypothetical protein